MEFKNFIFDMDGTIWNSAKPSALGFTRGIQEYGLKDRVITEQDIRNNFGKTLDDIAKTLLPELPAQEACALMSQKCVPYQYEEMEQDVPGILYPGVREVLTQLSESHGVYIVSNCLDGYIDMLFDHTDLAQFVKDTAWYANPHDNKAANIRHIVDKHCLEAPVYIGDIQGDFIASTKAGVEFIFAAYGFGEVPEAKYRIENFGDLTQYMAGR